MTNTEKENERLRRDAAWLLTRERIADRMNITRHICVTCLDDIGEYGITSAKDELITIIANVNEVQKILVPRYNKKK